MCILIKKAFASFRYMLKFIAVVLCPLAVLISYTAQHQHTPLVTHDTLRRNTYYIVSIPYLPQCFFTDSILAAIGPSHQQKPLSTYCPLSTLPCRPFPYSLLLPFSSSSHPFSIQLLRLTQELLKPLNPLLLRIIHSLLILL